MDPRHEKQLELQVLAVALKDMVERTVSLSWIFAFLFGLYGFTSIGFIHKFVPTLTVWENVWPRLVFCSLPFVAVGFYIKRSRISERAKLFVWITAFSAILHATAWIEIWPITLTKSPDILTYVHAANVYLFAIVYAVVAPPARYLLPFTSILLVLFVIPLLAVAHHAGDPVIFNMILNDSGMALAFSVILSTLIDRLRLQIARLKVEKEMEASKFLGPVLSKAIFLDEKSRLERIRCRAFVVSIDIRDSTDMQQLHRDKWLTFRNEYFTLVSQVVSRHEGYIQKTVGDCHVINFGVMDFGVDLSDIPGIEDELQRAEDRRLQRTSDLAFGFIDELFTAFQGLSKKHFPLTPVFLGAGIDKGWVERGVQGDSSHALELDVNGDPVNCSNRLQDYSKVIRKDLGWEASILVVSPFASDFLMDLSPFVRVKTVEKPIRNYAGIKWALARKYAAEDVKKARGEQARAG